MQVDCGHNETHRSMKYIRKLPFVHESFAKKNKQLPCYSRICNKPKLNQNSKLQKVPTLIWLDFFLLNFAMKNIN